MSQFWVYQTYAFSAQKTEGENRAFDKDCELKWLLEGESEGEESNGGFEEGAGEGGELVLGHALLGDRLSSNGLFAAFEKGYIKQQIPNKEARVYQGSLFIKYRNLRI